MGKTPAIDNRFIADVLEEVALQLESQGASSARIEGFRQAAASVRSQKAHVQTLALKGDRQHVATLLRLGISEVTAIEEIVHTGKLRLLERLKGKTAPAEVFSAVSGVSKRLANLIHSELEIDTLEDLEVAAHDGRLQELTEYAPRRMKMIQNALAKSLRYSSRRGARRFEELEKAGVVVSGPKDTPPAPSLPLLLRVDAEYRTKSRQNVLTKLKPTETDEESPPWLPILHTEAEGWQFTAMYEISDRAFAGGQYNERVVLVYEQNGCEGQRTVITSNRGKTIGRRVIVGFETACANLEQRRPSVRPLRGRSTFGSN